MLSPDELTELLAISRDSMEVDICERIEAHIREQAAALRKAQVIIDIYVDRCDEFVGALRKANEALRTAREVIEYYRRGKHEKTFGPAAHWLVTHPVPTNPSEGEMR